MSWSSRWAWLGRLLVIAAALLPALSRAEQDYHVRFEAVKTRAGVTLGYIDAILQDSRGFIWLGGENGLARYDGYQFRVFRNHPDGADSLSNNTVWSLAEDANGDLWVATEGGVNRYNRSTDNFTHFKHHLNDSNSLSHDTVRAVRVIRDGNILVGTFGGGAGLLEPTSGRFTPLQPRYATSNVWSVNEDLSGKLWLGTEGAGASSYDPASRTFTHYHTQAPMAQRIDSDTVRAITQDRAGDIWLGTDAGVYRLQGGAVVDHWQHVPGQNASLGSNVV